MIDYKNAKGWLRPEEREALFNLSSEQGIDFIINIGVEYGASLACLRAGDPHAYIYGFDIDIGKAVSHYNCILVEKDSGLAAQEWPGGVIDLVFVDGDHSYDGVKRDLFWIQHIRYGGYVIFHDCYDFEDPSIIHKVCPGVNQAVEEWYYDSYEGTRFQELDSIGTMRIFRRVE